MRKRLLLLVVISDLLVLIVLAVSVLPLTSSRVLQDQESRMRGQIMTVVQYLFDNTPTPEETEAFLATVDIHEGTRIGVASKDGAVGRGADRFAGQRTGNGPPPNTPISKVEKLYPWFFYEIDGDRVGSQAVTNSDRSWIVDGVITADLLKSEERARWLLIGFYYVLALGVSLIAASLIARRLVKPVRAAVATAEALGRGELRTPLPTRGPPEVVALGTALQALGGRIERLLESERERSAHLSHTLRTPLTVIGLEVDRLKGTTELDLSHLEEGLADLEHSLDEVIRRSSRTRTDGVSLHCDARRVLLGHLTYWEKLADLQGRITSQEITPQPSTVSLSEQDLGTVLDALLSNVFRHTASTAAYRARLQHVGRYAELEISNAGDERESAVPGSTGIGLLAARATIESAGGSFELRTADDGGVRVTLMLPLVAP